MIAAGTKRPSFPVWRKIAKALGVRTSVLGVLFLPYNRANRGGPTGPVFGPERRSPIQCEVDRDGIGPLGPRSRSPCLLSDPGQVDHYVGPERLAYPVDFFEQPILHGRLLETAPVVCQLFFLPCTENKHDPFVPDFLGQHLES